MEIFCLDLCAPFNRFNRTAPTKKTLTHVNCFLLSPSGRIHKNSQPPSALPHARARALSVVDAWPWDYRPSYTRKRVSGFLHSSPTLPQKVIISEECLRSANAAAAPTAHRHFDCARARLKSWTRASCERMQSRGTPMHCVQYI